MVWLLGLGASSALGDCARYLSVAGVTEVAGRETTLSVSLAGTGNENALSFSLSFDPARLTYLGQTPGAGAAATSLFVNTNQAAAGALGLMLARPAGQSFPAGSNELARLSFLLSSSPATTSVSFADAPLTREVVDSLANDLCANYTNARVAITPLYPPTILADPLSQTLQPITNKATNVTFTVSAGGSPPLRYQWRWNDADLASASTASLTLTNVGPAQAGNYNVIVANDGGAVTSQVAVLTVLPALVPPAILANPRSQTVSTGETVYLSVAATGSAPLSYQWQLNGAALSQATNALLVFTNTSLSQSGNYRAIVTNNAGAATSQSATLTVSTNLRIVRIVSTAVATSGTIDVPIELAGFGDESAVGFSLNFAPAVLNFTSVALGPGAAGAGLLVNTNNLGSGGIGIALTRQAGQTFASGTNRILLVRFVAGSASGPAMLSFGDQPIPREVADVLANPRPASFRDGVVNILATAPSITQDPQSLSAPIFSQAVFQAGVAGSTPLGFQWQWNGADLAGATDSVLTLNQVRPAMAGSYRLIVTNAAGTAASAAATLSVPRVVRAGATNGPTGNLVEVPVQLLAAGDENSLGFSLDFDAAQMTVAGVVGGASLGAGALNANTNRAGHLGVAIAQPNNAVFGFGTQEVARIQFLLGQQPGTAALAWSDAPVVRELADTNASSLAVQFQPVAVGIQLLPPLVTRQPSAQTVLAGSIVTFDLAVSGSKPMSWQWQKNGADLLGATNATLAIANVQSADNGNYSVRISNAAGTASSGSATLTVLSGGSLTHAVTTATSPAGLATVTGAGTYTNGQSANLSAPLSITIPPYIYSFREFQLNGTPVLGGASLSVTFSALDPANMDYVAVYDAVSILPLVIHTTANYPDLVPATTNYVLSFQFNRSMDTRFTPLVALTNTTSSVQAVVPAGGSWSATVLANDTFTLPPLTFSDGMDGAHQVWISQARDLNGNALALTNVLTVRVDMTPYPDLLVDQLAASPLGGWLPGSTVTIAWQLTNSGAAFAATNWMDSVVVRNTNTSVVILNTTTNYNPADDGPVAPGEFRDRALAFTMPSGANAYGVFEVTVTADSGNSVFEDNPEGTAELNNSRTIQVLSAPDLVPEGLAVSADGPIQSGTTIAIAWNDLNSGTVETGGPFYDRVTVVNTSTSEVLWNSTLYYDPAVAGNGPVAPGASRARFATFRLPDGTRGAGTLQVSVALDTFNQVPEFNGSGTGEANNTASATVLSSIAAYPDLQVTGLTVQPAVLGSGTNLTISWSDANTGSAPVPNGWYDRLTISNSTRGVTLLNTTLYYDPHTLGPLTNGEARARSYAFQLPYSSNGAGGLVFSVSADCFNNVFEYNPEGTAESNNTASLARSSALTPLPDLVITGLDATNSAFSSQIIGAQLRVSNQGLVAANADLVQRVFLSSTPLAGTGTLVAQADYNGPLAVGETLAQSVTLLTPAIPGTYWLIAQADANNNVVELAEDNNYYVSPTPLTVQPAYAATIVADTHAALANTPIPMHGQAVVGGSGAPAAFVPVTIHVQVRGTDRTFTVLTDANGSFTNLFVPLPNEAGVYQLAAALPSVAAPPAQDTFVLIGMSIAPMSLVDLVDGTAVTNSVRVDNLSDVPLTELSAAVVRNQSNLAVTATLSTNKLEAFATANLTIAVKALDASIFQSPVVIQVSSAEGAVATLNFPVRVERLTPALVASPRTLEGAMQRGAQTPVSFTLANQGGVATGPLQVVLPDFSWMALASPAQLPPLDPGSNAVVTLLLNPEADLPFGDYTGMLVVQSTNAAIPISFSFRAVSSATGNLLVSAQDEYTFFAAGSPPVTNAQVILSDALSGTAVATNFTGPQGTASLTNLREAFYIVDVTAPGHAPFRQSALVAAGLTTNVDAFLTRQTVTY